MVRTRGVAQSTLLATVVISRSKRMKIRTNVHVLRSCLMQSVI